MHLPRCLLLLSVSACAAAPLDAGPDAALPSLRAIWSPQTCRGDSRARIQLRLEDTAGIVDVASAPCGEGSLDAPVAHIGWYLATALVVDADHGGVAIATTTLAVDGQSVTWRLPW